MQNETQGNNKKYKCQILIKDVKIMSFDKLLILNNFFFFFGKVEKSFLWPRGLCAIF